MSKIYFHNFFYKTHQNFNWNQIKIVIFYFLKNLMNQD